MSETSAYVLIIFLAFGGFLIARYISHHKKNSSEAMVCPLKANCDSVIHSDYSKIFGIPVEVLGMVYYCFIAVSYGLVVIFPLLGMPLIVSGLMFASVCAFVFSVYLTLIQAFILKNWCTWCLISAFLCGMIFALDASVSPFYSTLFSSIFLSI